MLINSQRGRHRITPFGRKDEGLRQCSVCRYDIRVFIAASAHICAITHLRRMTLAAVAAAHPTAALQRACAARRWRCFLRRHCSLRRIARWRSCAADQAAMGFDGVVKPCSVAPRGGRTSCPVYRRCVRCWRSRARGMRGVARAFGSIAAGMHINNSAKRRRKKKASMAYLTASGVAERTCRVLRCAANNFCRQINNAADAGSGSAEDLWREQLFVRQRCAAEHRTWRNGVAISMGEPVA